MMYSNTSTSAVISLATCAKYLSGLMLGGAYPLEKIKLGAAGQIDDLLSKCSERAFFPRFSSFFLLSAKRVRRSRCGQGARVR